MGKGKGDRYKNVRRRNKYFLDMYNSHECAVKIYADGLSEKEAFSLEKERIKYYRENTNYRLTNMTDGGEGISGFVCSEETKQKTSIYFKELWKDPAFHTRMMEIRNDPNGVYKSEKFRQKISALVKGENNPNYNNHWSQEQKDHLSAVRKSLGLAKGKNNPKAKSVICLETGEVFECISEAMKKYHVVNEASFSVALKSRQKTAAGMHWMVFREELRDEDTRFLELIKSLSLSEKMPIVGIQTHEVFLNRKAFLDYF